MTGVQTCALPIYSLDVVEIIMNFEDTFGIEIKDEDAEKIKSIGEAVALIHTYRTK